MKNNQSTIKHSKFLSLILRHSPETIGITLDSEGWTSVQILLQQMIKYKHPLKLKELIQIVETNEKKRFQLSADQDLIRAVQGHSSQQVRRKYLITAPPDELFHGTATQFVESIQNEGLLSGERHHVHLSSDLITAKKVGQRHGKVIIFKVNAKQMLKDGFKFYQAENGVWLSDSIPSQYLDILNQ